MLHYQGHIIVCTREGLLLMISRTGEVVRNYSCECKGPTRICLSSDKVIVHCVYRQSFVYDLETQKLLDTYSIMNRSSGLVYESISQGLEDYQYSNINPWMYEGSKTIQDGMMASLCKNDKGQTVGALNFGILKNTKS